MLIFIVLLFFVCPILIYRKFYFKYISCVRIPSDGLSVEVCSVKPNRKWLHRIGCGARTGCVKLGSNVAAVFVCPVTDDTPKHVYNGVSLYGDVYLFKTGFLGKFASVDLSDRLILDVINKVN